MSFDEAVAAIRELLKRRQFAILTEIDVSKVFRKSGDPGFRPYWIFVARSLPFGRRAIEADSRIGSALPRNIVVQECGGQVEISVADPMTTIGTVNHIELVHVASELRAALENMISDIESSRALVSTAGNAAVAGGDAAKFPTPASSLS
jgi:uncharacterized protein (DUF302 family)